MAKLKLVADPTFKAKVGIPVAGGPNVEVLFTFKHRTKDELQAFRDAIDGRSDVESCLEMVAGWELDDEFTAANIALLFQNYIQAPVAIFQTYLRELNQARLGN